MKTSAPVSSASCSRRSARLATPTTDEKRLPAVLKNTAGFVYYVSITGITGAASADNSAVAAAVSEWGTHTVHARTPAENDAVPRYRELYRQGGLAPDALGDYASSVGREQLFELVTRDDVESRIVSRIDGRWHVEHGIVAIPTLMLYTGGEPAATAIGAQPKGSLERSLGLVEA